MPEDGAVAVSVDEKTEELGVVALLAAAEAVVTSAHPIGGVDGPGYVVSERAIRVLSEAVAGARAADRVALRVPPRARHRRVRPPFGRVRKQSS